MQPVGGGGRFGRDLATLVGDAEGDALSEEHVGRFKQAGRVWSGGGFNMADYSNMGDALQWYASYHAHALSKNGSTMRRPR